MHGEIERWEKTQCPWEFISKLRLKANGFFVYWRKERECTDLDMRRLRM